MPQTGVDEADEQQADSFEQAAAEAIAPLIVAAVLSSDGGEDDDSHAAVIAAIGLGLLALLRSSGTKMLTDLGLESGAVPQVVDRTIQAQYDRAVDDTIRSIADSAQNIRESLNSTAPGQEGTSDAAGRGPGQSGPWADLDPQEVASRAQSASERIGRRTMMQAREGYREALAADAGILAKTWRTRRDNRVRLSHAALEGESVPLSQVFHTIDGDRLRYPGDPTAPLRATAGCRCHLSYRIRAGADYQRRLLP